MQRRERMVFVSQGFSEAHPDSVPQIEYLSPGGQCDAGLFRCLSLSQPVDSKAEDCVLITSTLQEPGWSLTVEAQMCLSHE